MTTKSNGLLDFLNKAGVTLPEESVSVPEWKREIVLRGFSARERDLFEEDNIRRSNAKAANGVRPKKGEAFQADLENFRARLVARTIVEDGMRTCANDKGEQMLGDQPAAVIDRLFAVAQRLHGMTDADVEDMQGNFEATGDSEQSTDAQASSDAQSLN